VNSKTPHCVEEEVETSKAPSRRRWRPRLLTPHCVEEQVETETSQCVEGTWPTTRSSSKERLLTGSVADEEEQQQGATADCMAPWPTRRSSSKERLLAGSVADKQEHDTTVRPSVAREEE
jgi:hypothetical protein